jgi:Flp pilus assembly protein TadG
MSVPFRPYQARSDRRRLRKRLRDSHCHGRRFLSRAFASFAGDHSGVTIIEFALIAPVFMLLIAGIFEVGMIYFRTAQLQSVADNAARQLRLSKISSTMTVGQFKDTYVCSTPPGPGTLGSMFNCSWVAISVISAADWTGINDINVNPQGIAVGGNSSANLAKLASVGAGQIGMLVVTYKGFSFFGSLSAGYAKTVTGGMKKSSAAYFPTGRSIFRVEGGG